MNRQEWTRIINEGGEGYNPYPVVESPEPRIWQLRERRDRIMATMTGTSTAEPRYAELERQLGEVRAEITLEEER